MTKKELKLLKRKLVLGALFKHNNSIRSGNVYIVCGRPSKTKTPAEDIFAWNFGCALLFNIPVLSLTSGDRHKEFLISANYNFEDFEILGNENRARHEK